MTDTGHMQPNDSCKPQVVVDFDLGKGPPTRLYFSAPRSVELAWRAQEVLPALHRIEHAIRQGSWAAGYLAYEAAAGLDPKMAEAMGIAPDKKHAMPLLAFALFDAPDADPVFADGLPGTHPCATPSASEPAGETGLQWSLNESPDDYAKKIACLREAIAAGDAYQINYTLRAHAQAGDGFSPWHYYEALRRRQQCRYGAYLDFGSYQVLSLSPELFFDWNRTDGRITTRPMKGTAPRGATPESDAAQALRLQTSAKERAENVMIVDLLRNDLSRVCTPASVRVEALCRLERYRYVQHLVSVVAGRLRPGLGVLDALEAAMPGGSVTGAPKHRACEIISAFEPVAREAYCGSIGYVGFDGTADFNLLIRTFVTAQGRITFSAGGGVTAASDPAAEHAESLHKAEGMLRVLESLGIGSGAES